MEDSMDEPKKRRSPILEIWRRLKCGKRQKKTEVGKVVAAVKQEEQKSQNSSS
jgi:hypothetical protein